MCSLSCNRKLNGSATDWQIWRGTWIHNFRRFRGYSIAKNGTCVNKWGDYWCIREDIGVQRSASGLNLKLKGVTVSWFRESSIWSFYWKLRIITYRSSNSNILAYHSINKRSFCNGVWDSFNCKGNGVWIICKECRRNDVLIGISRARRPCILVTPWFSIR